MVNLSDFKLENIRKTFDVNINNEYVDNFVYSIPKLKNNNYLF